MKMPEEQPVVELKSLVDAELAQAAAELAKKGATK